MARNRYDIDEVMEDHFDLGQLKRLGHYVLPFKKDMFLAAFLMLSASAVSYTHLDVYKRQAQRCFCPPET